MGVPMWLGSSVRQFWQFAMTQGMAGADCSRIATLIESWAGVRIRHRARIKNRRGSRAMMLKAKTAIVTGSRVAAGRLEKPLRACSQVRAAGSPSSTCWRRPRSRQRVTLAAIISASPAMSAIPSSARGRLPKRPRRSGGSTHSNQQRGCQPARPPAGDHPGEFQPGRRLPTCAAA